MLLKSDLLKAEMPLSSEKSNLLEVFQEKCTKLLFSFENVISELS